MNDYKRKITYLNRYNVAKSHIDMMTDELAELYDLQSKCDFTGMPSTPNISDPVYNLIETIERKIETVQNEIAALIIVREKIREDIGTIRNAHMRKVLFCKYILGLSWKEVCEHMPGFGQNTLYKIHNQAVKLLLENDKQEEK